MPDPAVVEPITFNTDKAKPIDHISGTIATDIRWSEACGLRLDYRLDQLWLLIEPRIILEVPEGTSGDKIEIARAFVRERRAQRRNLHANAMLDGWISLIGGTSARFRLRAFDIGDGIDAEFELIRVSGFSGRAR